MEDTARTAYLFQCQGEDLFAISHDKSGSNIPRSPCTHGWHLCEAFCSVPISPCRRRYCRHLFSRVYRLKVTTCGADGVARVSDLNDDHWQTGGLDALPQSTKDYRVRC